MGSAHLLVWYAAAANQILALPVTGSIGAYSKAVDRSGFAKALGMEEDGVLAGKNAMLLPECANMSKAQRKQLNAQTERCCIVYLRGVADIVDVLNKRKFNLRVPKFALWHS